MLELALAVLVIAIGVLALFSLFKMSTDSVARTEADTRIALFGEEVMSGLRGHSQDALWNRTWEQFWDDFAHNRTNLQVACGGPDGVWANTGMVLVANTFCTNSYTNYAIHTDCETNIVSHSLRYRLDIAASATLIPPWTNRMLATLTVWDGMYGPTNADEAIVFYTEFSRLGEVP